MAQFTAYENPNPATQKAYPYLLEIQANLLDELRTTVVIPLMPLSLAGKTPIAKLCPVVEIAGKSYVALTQQIAGIERKRLGKLVDDLSHYRADIVAAMDFLISGV